MNRYCYISRLLKIDYPNTGNAVKGLTFDYDNNKWLTKINAIVGSSEKAVREYVYDSAGKVEKMISHDGFADNSSGVTVRKYSYDELNQPVKMEYLDSNSANANVIESYEYTYDKNGNIKSEDIYNGIPESDENKLNHIRSYDYDSVDRLVRTEIAGEGIQKGYSSSTEYSYDDVGNLIKEEKDGIITVNTYNGLNQLTRSDEQTDSEPGEDEGTYESYRTYKYDKYGNQTEETHTAGFDGETSDITKTMRYDVDNRLSELVYQNDDGKSVTQVNEYNGDNQRISKSEGGETTKYYYQGTSVLYTTDGSGNTNALNIVGLSDNTIATARGAGQSEKYYFYHNDVRGSTTNIVNSDKESMVSYEYTDFGETTIKGDQDFYNEICYTGGIYDRTTGLYYLNARYYNPTDARFLTQDTYRGENADPSSLHLYALR